MKRTFGKVISLCLVFLVILSIFPTTNSLAKNTKNQINKSFNKKERISNYIIDLKNNEEFIDIILAQKTINKDAIKIIEKTIEENFQTTLSEVDTLLLSIFAAATTFVICLILYPVVTPFVSFIGFISGFIASISEVGIIGGILTGIIFCLFLSIVWPFAISSYIFALTMGLLN